MIDYTLIKARQAESLDIGRACLATSYEKIAAIVSEIVADNEEVARNAMAVANKARVTLRVIQELAILRTLIKQGEELQAAAQTL